MACAALLAAGVAGWWLWPGSHNRLGDPRCCLHIAHAGGAIDGQPLTNSPEALDANYAKGLRIFELDFLRTGDGEIVLAHDWNAQGGVPPETLEAFRALPPAVGVSRMSLADLAGWLRAHEEAVIVTDTKFEQGPGYLADALEAHFSRDEIAARFVFQVYSLDELRAAAGTAPDFRHILTIYRMRDLPDMALIAGIQDLQLLALTMPVDRAAQSLEALRAELPGLPIYVHGPVQIINGLRLRMLLKRSGASGFYLD